MGNRVVKVLSLLGILGIGIIVLIAGMLSYYAIKSPGKMIQYKDEQGNVLANSIASKEYIEINGAKLGMIVKSRDLTNPVLLFLHGGVGMPEYGETWDYPTYLEDHFTVVWLEQRGAGLSYHSEMKGEDITTKQYISDIIEVSKYLCQRFNTEKIYLMAHSAGTYTAIQAASKAPELYYAYIGTGQYLNQQESDELAYEYMLDYFAQTNQKGTLKKLKTAYETGKFKSAKVGLMFKAGIETMRKGTSYRQCIFTPTMNCPEYTLGEKINIWRGILFVKGSTLGKEIHEADIRKIVTKLEVPVYFLSGKYDYITNRKLVQEYEEQLEAPAKGYYLFENSAHCPIFEEPEATIKIMEEIKKNTKVD